MVSLGFPSVFFTDIQIRPNPNQPPKPLRPSPSHKSILSELGFYKSTHTDLERERRGDQITVENGGAAPSPNMRRRRRSLSNKRFSLMQQNHQGQSPQGGPQNLAPVQWRPTLRRRDEEALERPLLLPLARRQSPGPVEPHRPPLRPPPDPPLLPLPPLPLRLFPHPPPRVARHRLPQVRQVLPPHSPIPAFFFPHA